MLLRTLFEAEEFTASSSEDNNKQRFEVEIFNYNNTLNALRDSKVSDLDYGTDIRIAERYLRILKARAIEASTRNYTHATDLQQQYINAVGAARNVWRGSQHSAYAYLHNRPHVWPDDENVGGTISGVVLVPEWLKQPPPKSYTVFVRPKNGSNNITRLFGADPLVIIDLNNSQEFSIKGIIPGEYTVFIQAHDYKALSDAKPVTVQAGKETNIKFSMEYDPPGSGLKTRVMPKW